MSSVLYQLQQKQDLTIVESRQLMRDLLSGEMEMEDIAAILLALKEKGEAVTEITGCILEARSRMTRIPVDGLVIDTCGTGGDSAGTFNISTAVALVVAGGGVPVAKHGNRGFSSRSGSADVLEALGVPLLLSPNQAADMLHRTGFVFLFAPLYHPSFKHVGPVRKSLGVPTIFNLLGPFLNPAGVKRQIVGVPTRAIAEKMTQVARQLSYEHLLLVTSDDGLDEISLGAPSMVYDVRGDTVAVQTIDPSAFGLKGEGKETIQGGDAAENAAIIRRIVSGEPGPYRDIVVLNAGAAFSVSGKVSTIVEGIRLAQESIDSGSAQQLIQQISFPL